MHGGCEGKLMTTTGAGTATTIGDKTYVVPGIRRVEDEEESGDGVDEETSDGQEIGGDGVRDPEHEPVPESLHERIQQSGAGAAVLVLRQSPQLPVRQHRIPAAGQRHRHARRPLTHEMQHEVFVSLRDQADEIT